MRPGLFAVLALAVAGVAGYVLWKRRKKASESLQSRGEGGNVDESAKSKSGINEGGTGPKAKSGIGDDYDALISSVATAEGADPVLLKAIVRKESDFDEEAINPERTFTLNGVTYSPSSSEGRKRLHDFIAGGGDPASIGVNPSLGLASVRVSTGKHFMPGLQALELFDPQMNLTLSAKLLRELKGAGITLETIDAYNVGQSRVLSGELRNLPYRDEVRANYALFQNDF